MHGRRIDRARGLDDLDGERERAQEREHREAALRQRGVVRTLAAPLAKRSLAVLAFLRALALTVEIVEPAGAIDPATVH